MFSTLRRILSNAQFPPQDGSNLLSSQNTTQPPETPVQKFSNKRDSDSNNENIDNRPSVSHPSHDKQVTTGSSERLGDPREGMPGPNQRAPDSGNPGYLIRAGFTFEQMCKMAYQNRGRPDQEYPKGSFTGLTFEEMSIISYCRRIPLNREFFIPLYFCVFCENQGCTGIFHQRQPNEGPTPEALRKFIEATHHGKIRLSECEEQCFGHALDRSSHSFIIEKEGNVERQQYWVVPSPTDEGWYLQRLADERVRPTKDVFEVKWYGKQLHCPYCDLDRPSYWQVAMFTPKTERRKRKTKGLIQAEGARR